jgi:hypothetical protein
MGTDLRRGCFVLAGIATVALMCLPSQTSAASADYCITCQNPSATYRCRVTGDGAKPSDALKLYCVIRTAKEGNHSSCKAQKATSGCVGLVKVYNYDGPALPESLTSDPRVRELQQRVERDQRTFQEPKGDEPSSLFELGGRAVDASKNRLRNAGAAIGIGGSESEPHAAIPPPQSAQSAGESEGFAHRSYRCMRSLFRNCGSVDKEALE